MNAPKLVTYIREIPTWILCFISHVSGAIAILNIGFSGIRYIVSSLIAMACITICMDRDDLTRKKP